MTTLLFSLVFYSSGVSYSTYTDLTLSQCVSRLIEERAAITQVQQRFPNFNMEVYCKAQ